MIHDAHFGEASFLSFVLYFFSRQWASANKPLFLIHFKEHTLSFYFLVKTKLCSICRKLKPHFFFTFNFPKLKFMGKKRSNKALAIWSSIIICVGWAHLRKVTWRTYHGFTTVGHWLLFPHPLPKLPGFGAKPFTQCYKLHYTFKDMVCEGVVQNTHNTRRQGPNNCFPCHPVTTFVTVTFTIIDGFHGKFCTCCQLL